MNSVNIKSMSDDLLIERVEYLVRRERELMECLIWHLQEIQDRKLFIAMGFTSLFECLVKHFKYSEAVAYSRISALKILNAVPEATQALNAGEVNITTLSLAQSFIRKQEKETGEAVSAEQKVQYLNSIKNKSVQEARQILASINPVLELPQDKIAYLDSDHAQLQAVVGKSVLEKIEKLKSLISHENLDPSYNELLNLALDAAIEKVEKKKGLLGKLNQPQVRTTRGFSIKSSRYISRGVKQVVHQRSEGRCEHVSSEGERCSSRFQLQFDHMTAFSKGGGSELRNIQHLCRVHNAAKSDR